MDSFAPKKSVRQNSTPAAGRVTDSAEEHTPAFSRHPRSAAKILHLQRTIGNHAVAQLMRDESGSNLQNTPGITSTAPPTVVQRQDSDDEEEEKEKETEGERGSATRDKPLPDDLLDVVLRGAAIAAWKTFAFQATRTRIIEQEGGISESGLQPRYGGTGASAGNQAFEEQSKNKVHYTRDYGGAVSYGKFLSAGVGFRGKVNENPEEAEILQVSLPNRIVSGEKEDPDDDLGKTTHQAIPPENVRRLRAERIPDRGEVLEARWQEHIAQSFASTMALISNMPEDAQDALNTFFEAGYDIPEIMQLVKQSLTANPASTFLERGQDDLLGKRAGRPDVNSLGHRQNEINPQTHEFSTPSQQKETEKRRKKEKKLRKKREKKEKKKARKEKKKGEKES